MPPLGAHRPGYAQLAFPFRGQHDEDKKDKQDAGYDGETTKEDESRGKTSPGYIGLIQKVLLNRLSLESDRLKPGFLHFQDLYNRIGMFRTLHGAAPVGNEDVVNILRGTCRLQSGKRHHH